MVQNLERFYVDQIRYQLIHIIDMLLEVPSQKEKANQLLNSLYHKFGQDKESFSLDSVVFHYFVQMIRTPQVQREQDTLIRLRKELLGEFFYTNIYAFKHNFVTLLSENGMEVYRALRELLKMRIDLMQMSFVADFPEEYETLRQSLYNILFDQPVPKTLPDLLIVNASKLMLGVSHIRSPHFDILDNFSSIYPISHLESLEAYLVYIEGLIDKLEGKTTLFVDIHLLPDGFLLNLR